MMFWDVHFTDRVVCLGKPLDDAYRKRNYDLCQGVNLTKLSCALNDMVEAGLPKEQAECFKASASALLQLMRTENNRLWAAARADDSPDDSAA